MESVRYPRRGILGFRVNLSHPFPDGYYMYTLMNITQSHGVIVEKRTKNNGKHSYYLFDPNGQYWAKKDIVKYLTVADNEKTHKLDVTISPSNSWNEGWILWTLDSRYGYLLQ